MVIICQFFIFGFESFTKYIKKIGFVIKVC